MLKQLKVFIAGFASCAMLMGGVAYAAGDAQIKAALLNTFKFKVYGADFTVKSSNGAALKPILYNNTTYVPVETIVKGLGVPVDNDKAKKILWIGGKTEIVQIKDRTYYENNYGTMITTDTSKLSTSDDTYKWGIANDGVASMESFGCYLKPGSKYMHFKTSIFVDESAKDALTFNICKDTYDGAVLKTITVNPGETVSDIDLEIGGINKIFIGCSVKINHGDIQQIVIGEPIFYNGTIQSDPTAVKWCSELTISAVPEVNMLKNIPAILVQNTGMLVSVVSIGPAAFMYTKQTDPSAAFSWVKAIPIDYKVLVNDLQTNVGMYTMTVLHTAIKGPGCCSNPCVNIPINAVALLNFVKITFNVFTVYGFYCIIKMTH